MHQFRHDSIQKEQAMNLGDSMKFERVNELKIKGNYVIITVWIMVFLIGLKVNMEEMLICKGIDVIGSEYYRFITALFLHFNLLHLLANAFSLYYIGYFLEKQIRPIQFIIFSLLGGTISNIIFSVLYPNSSIIGGSPICFALIGLIVIYQIFKPESMRFRMGTWYGNWIVGYFFLGNIPIFSHNVSTLVIHMIALVIGMILGFLWVKIDFTKIRE